ncbi:hypothetical protein THAOC_27045 [Thalassiosira oceanica]|uniref:Polysaccharide biosynthesis protein C-terminal domain-containing protein n=1 Tax=Thalassiosira oceanica TaxID=159749 RepID=K0RMM0_THAOC|nr:hypothetical protein THAOC_27045 [Thalassiosira oceanica]|eukprot:EJK53509.1 hypothetical protein THAOC_27045 [Thalassiosira oceanica]
MSRSRSVIYSRPAAGTESCRRRDDVSLEDDDDAALHSHDDGAFEDGAALHRTVRSSPIRWTDRIGAETSFCAPIVTYVAPRHARLIAASREGEVSTTMAWTIRLRVRLALVLVACVPTSEGLAYRQVPVVIRGQQGHSFCRPGHSCRATVRAFASEPNEERDGGGSVALDLDIDGNLSSWQRFIASLPSAKGDEMDRRILSTAIPSMVNLLVVPLVNAVDTFYVGNLGSAEALAAQSSANQIFFSIYFLAAFLPTITAPLVADAIGKEDWKSAKQRVCESLFLGNILGGLFSLALLLYPARVLRLVVPPSTDSAVMALAVPYLRCRALGMIPTLVASTGFAAYRGLLNTVTPLKVTIVTNLLNLVLDPILIGGSLLRSVFGGFGAAGAAIATSASEFTSSLIYLRLLFRRKLVDWTKLIKPPSLASLLPLVQGGFAMLIRQMTLNVAFVSAARRAQAMDSSGTMAAAYAIVMQIYSLGVVLHLGIQGTAAALVPSARAMGGAQGDEAARKIADRIFSWGTLLGVILALVQMVASECIQLCFYCRTWSSNGFEFAMS